MALIYNLNSLIFGEPIQELHKLRVVFLIFLQMNEDYTPATVSTARKSHFRSWQTEKSFFRGCRVRPRREHKTVIFVPKRPNLTFDTASVPCVPRAALQTKSWNPKTRWPSLVIFTSRGRRCYLKAIGAHFSSQLRLIRRKTRSPTANKRLSRSKTRKWSW